MPSREDTRRELHTATGVLRYHDYGSGPALVMLHGSGPGVSGWSNFGANLDTFGDHFRCLVLEFPGYGVSDHVPGPAPAVHHQAVLDLMNGLSLGSAMVLGNSMGGGVALRLAQRCPGLVTKLVTVGGVGVNVVNPFPSEGIRLLTEFADNPSRDTLVRWLRSMVYDPAFVTESLIEERWERATTGDAPATIAAAYGSAAMARRQAAASDQVPYWAQLGHVAVPALLTWGREDRVSPLDMGMFALRHLPRAELHVFPRCGHWVMHEQRDAFETHVTAFLLRTS
jgi:pimeloyl-ACP methyl ester carboxylesterase